MRVAAGLLNLSILAALVACAQAALHGAVHTPSHRRLLRVGHAGGRVEGTGSRLARGRLRRRQPARVVHAELFEVRSIEERSYVKHLIHARGRHLAKLVAGVNSTRSGGVSQKEIDAAQSNAVTQPNGTPGKNSGGLAIEADDVGYFMSLSIGTPGQTFKILVDSGSADTWVPSTACGQRGCGPHTALGAATSSTFIGSKAPFAVTYGTGNVKGTLCQDTLDVAGLKLANHTFGVTSVESVEFNAAAVPFDGLMGTALSTLSEQRVPTVIESLKAAGLVDKAQMGYALGRVADQTNIGQVTFGGVDNSKFTGKLKFVPNVSKTGFWEVRMSDVTVDGAGLGLKGRTAILDSGTTLIIAPLADAIKLHEQIPGAKADGQGDFTVPCTVNTSIALQIGGQTLAMQPGDLAFLPVDPKDPTGDCQSAIAGSAAGNSGLGSGEWLVGAAFLKNAYFSTIIDTNEIGLAPLKQG